MSGNPQKFTSRAFALRLAAFFAALFVTLGVQLPFLPVWLAAKGLDAGAIGIVLAVPMIVRVLAIPLATRAADRRDALRATIVMATAAAVVGYVALGFAEGMIAIMAAYAFASAAYTPVFLLTDAYALRGLAERGRAYGPVRLWGSVAFIAASLCAGSLLDVIPAHDLIWLIVAAMGLAAATACALAPLSGGGARLSATHPSANTLLRNPAFLAVAAAASLVQASHALYYGFSTIDWQTEGFNGTTIGALWALGVLGRDCLVRDLGTAAVCSDRAHRDRCRRRGDPLERDGTRAAGGGAAGAASLACAVVRRDPPRRARLRHACGATGARSDRARLSWRCPRPGDGGRNGTLRRALWALWRPRLCGNGADRRCWRSFRAHGASAGAARRRRELAPAYWQVGYIEVSARPVRYFMFCVRPPCRAIHRRTCCG